MKNNTKFGSLDALLASLHLYTFTFTHKHLHFYSYTFKFTPLHPVLLVDGFELAHL